MLTPAVRHVSISTSGSRTQSDRQGKNGSKILAMVDARDIPLALFVIGANRHDGKGLENLLRSKVFHPDESILRENAAPLTENLLLDAGVVACDTVAEFYGYVPLIRPRSEERRAKIPCSLKISVSESDEFLVVFQCFLRI